MSSRRVTLFNVVAATGWSLLPVALLIVLVGITGAYPMKLIQRIVDIAVTPGGMKSYAILQLGAVYVFFFVLWGLAKYVLGVLYHSMEASQAHGLRTLIWRHALRLKPLAAGGTSGQDVVVDLLKDSEIASSHFMQPLVYIVQSATNFVAGAVVMLSIDWRMTLVVFPLGLFSALLSRQAGGKMRSLTRRVRDRTTAMWSLFSEAIRGLKDLQANDATEMMYHRLVDRSNDTARASVDEITFNERTEALNSVVFMSSIGLIMTFGALLVAAGKLSIGGLTAFMMYNGMLVDPVLNFIRFYRDMQATTVSLERINRLFDYPAFPAVASDRASVNIASPDIDVNGVWLSFEGRSVLKGVDLHIAAGSSVALVGPSGCGKTTLAHVILGLYTADKGSVTIGGITVTGDIAPLLREVATIVHQEPYLFTGSVADNVRMGRLNAKKEEVARAIRLAGLPEDDRGVASRGNVGESGLGLSGGERQRVALARAFLRRTPLVICDEATSALDSSTTKAVLADILSEFRDSTILFIAHRISAITGLPRIIVMADGEIVGDGEHRQLLEGCQLYRELYNNQFAEGERLE